MSPLLGVPGAVPGEGVDAPVAWHYGDPVREQRALDAGTAVVDLSHRGVVRIGGPDRLSWLHSLTTQSLIGLAPGLPTEALVLSPHGHIEHDLHLVDDGEAAWVTVEPGAATGLVAWLGRMRFMLRVEVADVSDDWAVLATSAQISVGAAQISATSAQISPGAAQISATSVQISATSAQNSPGAAQISASAADTTAGTSTAGAGTSAENSPGAARPSSGSFALPPGSPPVWTDPWPALGAVSASYAAVDADGHPGADRIWRELLVPRGRLADAVAGHDLAGTWAAEALRVAAWRPRFGFETDHRTIPHEVDWLRTAVHLQKGCYRGQETVARVHNLGRPPRRLVMLHLDGSENVLPEHGAAVVHGGRPVGQVTTAARHHELGPIALALVKRSLAPDAVLTVDGVPAAQELVVAC